MRHLEATITKISISKIIMKTIITVKKTTIVTKMKMKRRWIWITLSLSWKTS